ncbi:MAG: alanine racemase [Rickettsiales bacterium]|jgi:alanine racemase|nr:alanine racemase [Rickettsiales bacterium]
MIYKDNFDIIRVYDEEAFARNVRRAAGATHARLGATIKSNAYGFGAERAAGVLVREGVRDFFVQTLAEAEVVLPSLASVKGANLFTFSGVMEGQEERYIESGIVPVCVSLSQLASYNSAAAGRSRKPRVGVHFDTGMNRTGLSVQDARELASDIEKLAGNLEIVLYISHLHGPFSYGKYCKSQLENFTSMVAPLPKAEMSLAASSGLLRLGAEYHFDIVRPGYALYGFASGMEQIVDVYARILQVREVVKGETIGYSDEYVARRKMKVAVLCLGYADGYSRGLSKTNGLFNFIRAKLHAGGGYTRAYADIGGRKCPLVGIVSMNNIIVDVSDVPGDILERAKYAQVMGKLAPCADFRNSLGYTAAENFVNLLRPNAAALDLTWAEFEKIRRQLQL